MPMIGVRAKVRALRLANPHWSLQDLANEVSRSRERVRQILVSEHLHTRRIDARSVFDAALESRDPRAYDSPAEDDAKVIAGRKGAPFAVAAWREAMNGSQEPRDG